MTWVCADRRPYHAHLRDVGEAIGYMSVTCRLHVGYTSVTHAHLRDVGEAIGTENLIELGEAT